MTTTFELPALGAAGQELFDRLETLGPDARFRVEGIAELLDFGRLVALDERLRELALTMRGQLVFAPASEWRATAPATGYDGPIGQ